MPQAILDNDNSLVDYDGSYNIYLPPYSFAAFAADSWSYVGFSIVSNFETVNGKTISQSWCPTEEAVFGRVMAYAAMARWEANNS